MEIQFGIKNGWGSQNYNIMGVAKAALECAVRYVASEVGPKGIRVHAISPEPLVTHAASGIPDSLNCCRRRKARPRLRSGRRRRQQGGCLPRT